jgi:hypothetical protein
MNQNAAEVSADITTHRDMQNYVSRWRGRGLAACGIT